MEWCVYVGQRAEGNYQIGFENGVWGQKAIFKNSKLREVKEGDRVYFFHDIKRLTPAVGKEKAGNLRIKLENYRLLGGYARQIKVCVVTRGFYEDSQIIWPNDIYPYRYDIELLETKNNILLGTEFQSDSVIKAILQSILTKGDAVPLENQFVDLDGENKLEQDEDIRTDALEGRPIYKLHLTRERNKKLIALKKKIASEADLLFCEACDFDFTKTYGQLGEGFIECHHNNPLSERTKNEQTKLDELTLLCSNCHRMVHRSKQWLSIEELRQRVKHE
jgi:5-methylcytosine-specific restriction protein A